MDSEKLNKVLNITRARLLEQQGRAKPTLDKLAKLRAKSAAIDALTVVWPDGTVQSVDAPQAGGEIVVRR